MTLPDERFNAVISARNFLRDLLDPQKTKKVPLEIRKRAKYILKHFPWDSDLECISKKCPEILSSTTNQEERINGID